jgi:hypothetical protein
MTPDAPAPGESSGADRTPGGTGGGKLRRRIAEEAARILSHGGDSRRARYRAARRLARGWVPEEDLPTHDEVRRELGPHAAGASAGDLPAPVGFAHLTGDRFDQIADLVRVLATVRQDPLKHPEGDALDHALQVFDRVYEERPFDEELLTAALVHEVGRAIDRANQVAAGLEALGDLVTPRTRWLVESLETAHAHADNTLGLRARHRLEAHPDFLDVLLLAEADRRSRVRGYDSPSLEEAIAILRDLEQDE